MDLQVAIRDPGTVAAVTEPIFFENNWYPLMIFGLIMFVLGFVFAMCCFKCSVRPCMARKIKKYLCCFVIRFVPSFLRSSDHDNKDDDDDGGDADLSRRGRERGHLRTVETQSPCYYNRRQSRFTYCPQFFDPPYDTLYNWGFRVVEEHDV
jgi:hypothetical protein